MQIDKIFHKFKKTIPHNLPGFDAQLKMCPPFRGKYTIDNIQKFNPKQSAVLILLYPKGNETHLVFIERAKDGKAHSGQIAFPGGKKEEKDKNYIETALREAHEEVGVTPDKVQIIGEISQLYVPVSNFIIQPVVAFSEETPLFIPQLSEVKKIFEVPLNNFLDKQNVATMDIEIKNSNSTMTVPTYNVCSLNIWGATAMIMSEFVEILRLE